MAAPSEKPQQMLEILEQLVKEKPTQEEMHDRIIKRLMGGISQGDARRIVYGEYTKYN